MKRKGHISFIAGFVAGAVAFGGAAAFAAAGITANLAASIVARPKTAAVVIDDQTVDLKGYLIEGSHCFQLRDLSASLASGGKDFSVVWDGANDRILIDTSRGYDPGEQTPQTPQTMQPTAPAAGGYGTTPKILKPGDVVQTANGDYNIEAGQLERQAELARHGLEFGKPLAPDAPLPAWQSEWDAYPRVTIPDVKPVRQSGDVIIQGQKVGTRDSLEVFNAYEVERMVRTIYKYAKRNPALWKDRDPSANVPAFTVVAERTEGLGFYPWENAVVPAETNMKNKVASGSAGRVFRVFAHDEYENGKYTNTIYLMD
jgi:hypothetical protein